MTHQRRGTDYGLDSPRGDEWRKHAACRDNPDWWFGNINDLEIAVHMCRYHCPVLDQCTKETQREPPVGCVQAAIQWTEGAKERPPRPTAAQPQEVRCGKFCGTVVPPRRKPPVEPVHGSPGAVWRHRRIKEPLCEACGEAERERNRERNRRRRRTTRTQARSAA